MRMRSRFHQNLPLAGSEGESCDASIVKSRLIPGPDSKEQSSAAGQNFGEAMVGLSFFRVDRGDVFRLTTRRWYFEQPGIAPEIDGVIGRPAGAIDVVEAANRNSDRRSARNWDLLQLPAGVDAQPLSVRREEWSFCALRAGDRAGV